MIAIVDFSLTAIMDIMDFRPTAIMDIIDIMCISQCG
jgi:hypothetical protein